MEVPDVLRPQAYKRQEGFNAVRAIDYIGDTPRFDVSKQFVDQNGGQLEPGDLVDVTVSLIPVGGAVGPIAYREQLSGPWIIYKDEYGHIEPFDYGSLPSDVKIERNISNGYEFMIHDLMLDGTKSFTYTAQYNGKKDVVTIEVETDKRNLFR
jgi:hypothetical protein